MTIQTNITNDTQPTPVAPPIAPSRLVAYTAEAIEDHGDDLKRLACTVDFLIDTIHASPIDWAGSNDGERARLQSSPRPSARTWHVCRRGAKKPSRR